MFRRTSSSQSGQVLIIFAFAFIGMLMMLALLFDGARALVLRRQMQDASDAAAVAGANVIQGLSPKQCSATAGPPPGAPNAAITAAAKASVAANMPDYPQANIVVTCASTPSEVNNLGVKVKLGENSPTFFGSIFGGGPLHVWTDSTAINGAANFNNYSVVMLNPSHLTWPNGQRGCPSFMLSGGPTVRFDSAIYIDSSCTAANGGAFSTNGNSASLTMGNGALIRIVGEYKPQALTISPAPLNGQPVKADPLAFLSAPPVTAVAPASPLYLRSNNKLVIGQGNSSSTVVLEPGVYHGGIQLKNQSIAYLHPGIYVMDGGGFQVGAGQKVYAVPAANCTTPTNCVTDATWATTCTGTNCGILLYNTGTTGNGVGAIGQIQIGAQATFKVRSYLPDTGADSTILQNGTAYHNETYRHLLIWQSAAPIPASNYVQPVMELSGGGNVFMAGTVYAPSAKVRMGGNSGGSGGDSIDLTLQFITWDLELYGNSNFYFRYNADQFAKQLDYGLIE